MGTRHLICVWWKGKWWVAQYGQWDGYPEGQGVKVFKFLSVARNIDNLKAGLENHVYELTEDDHNVSHKSLSRDTGAGILGIIARAGQEFDGDDSLSTDPKKIPLCSNLGFVNDTLFCEWVYVVDLDKNILEIYMGVADQVGKDEEHRFKDVGPEGACVPRLVCSFKFQELFLLKSEEEFLEKVTEQLKLNGEEGDGEEENNEEE